MGNGIGHHYPGGFARLGKERRAALQVEADDRLTLSRLQEQQEQARATARAAAQRAETELAAQEHIGDVLGALARGATIATWSARPKSCIVISARIRSPGSPPDVPAVDSRARQRLATSPMDVIAAVLHLRQDRPARPARHGRLKSAAA